jgi:TonB-linked SusC/RagA family outer membrane protein
MKKRNFTLFILFAFSYMLVVGQIKVKGKVLDDKNEPVIGASVLEKGSKNGTVSDVNGNFVLTVSGTKSILTASYIGSKSQSQTVGNSTQITFELESAVTELGEVVAVGYGNMRKSDITGSVSSVKVKDSETTPTISVDQMLKGKTSGVYVNTASSEPGGTATVRIRGVNSLSANNDPLYVVDGVPMENVGSGSDPFNRAQQKTNPLAYLSPQDILSIEVLKDASATAIYGFRGANGVVLITTKSGDAGIVKVNITSSLSMSTIRKKINMLNGPDYARYRNEVRLRDGLPIIYGNTEASAPENLLWIDWQDAVLQTGISNNSRISLSGGTKTSNYYLAAGYDANQGIVKNTDFNRGDIRFNFNTDLSKSIKLSFNMGASSIASRMMQTTGDDGKANTSAIRSMLSKIPLLTIVADGTNDSEQNFNLPTSWITDYKDDLTENNVSSKLGLSFQINKILRFETKGSYNFKQNERFKYYKRTLSAGGNGGTAGFSSLRYTGINWDNLLHIDLPINKNNRLSGVAGVEYSNSEFRSLSTASSNFTDDVLGYEAFGSATISTPLLKNHSQVNLFSYLARLNYSLYNKYIITITGRYDGSSKFAPGHKWGLFPSAAVAWRAKEEIFLKDVEAVSNLKLRLGWGQTGNQGIGAYATLARYGPYSSWQPFYPYQGSTAAAYPLQSIANPYLGWEKQEQINGGIDIGVLKDRLSFSIDAYYKYSHDMLINKELPPSSGIGSTMVNFGSIENKGIDFSINAVIINHKDFKWTADGNLSIYRNKILNLGLPVSSYGYVQFWGGNIQPIGDLQQPANTFIEGQPAGLFWGYKTAGVYQNREQINAWTSKTQTADLTKYYFGGTAKPGDIIYVDNNGDGVVTAADYTIIGNPNPEFTWGFNTNFSYKQLSLAIAVVGVQGKDVFNANLNREDQMAGGIYNIRQDAWNGRWQGEGTSNTFPAATTSQKTNQMSDRLIEDASFARLANVTLSYMIKFGKNFPLKDTKIFVTGNNLLTLTKYRGFDPEVDSFGGSSMIVGVDNNSYPSSRSVIFGLNINF